VISTRYVPAVIALVSLAIVPTVVHSYVGVTVQDGRTTGAIPRRLDGIDGIDTNRSAAWVREAFAADDFIERRHGGVTLFVARGFDAKRLYHHPELGVAYGRQYSASRTVRVPSGSREVALHLLIGDGGLAGYALLYDDEFIEDPMSFQVRQAFAMLFNPRKQTTLFFAHGPASPDPLASPVVHIVVSAIDSFVAQPHAAVR
jgi:hypothetical protein